MDTKLLLNFPKVRSITQEISFLLNSLDYIQKNAVDEINFEFNADRTQIRKKNIDSSKLMPPPSNPIETPNQN
jgi:hypothetical protein